MARLRVLISDTYNPWFNLATEDWIFREVEPDAQTLFLWRNSETVVIGRNQNPWSECHLAKMEEDGVHLARRTSGGGAVFHDLGNTNFTFLSPKEGYNRATNLGVILAALERFGIKGEASGRNDLVVMAEDGPRKFSGSAFRETRDRCFHHGTLLIDANLSRLANYLTPHPKKLESKGRASVRARVMNLKEAAHDLTHEALSSAIIEEFFKTYGGTCEIESLDPNVIGELPGLRERYAEFSSWDWRFGHAPQFRHQMVEYLSWGFIELHLDSERGHVARAQLFSDSLFPSLVEAIQRSLEGKAYSKAGVEMAVAEALEMEPERTHELREFEAWLKSQVEV